MNATNPPKTGPKFRRRAESRPDEVLDAALDLFIEHGYAATSVQAIARRAGISKGAVYLYFASKQAILEGLILRAVAPISDQAIADISSQPGDVRETVSKLMRALALRLSDPRVLAIPHIIIREAVIAPDIATMYRKAVLDQAIPAMTALIRAGIETGQLRKVDPELTIRSIMGPLVIHVFLSEVFGIAPPGGMDMTGLVDNHLAILFDGLALPKDTPHE